VRRCTLGNGYFAARGAAPESRADGVHYPGTYIAACWNRLRDEVDGKIVDNESIVNLPNWLPVTIAIDGGEWLDPERVEVLTQRQELDLRRGISPGGFGLVMSGAGPQGGFSGASCICNGRIWPGWRPR